MNEIKLNLKKVIYTIPIYTIIGMILVYNFNNVDYIYRNEYILLCTSYFIIGGIFFYIINRFNINIFEPFILISVLYIFIFTITPIVFIIQGKTDAHGAYVMDGCIKATCIYIISYIAFVVGYTTHKNKVKKNYKENNIFNENIRRKKIIMISLIIWIISYLFSLIFLFSTGRSLLYILTVGGNGTIEADANGSLLGFISNFSYSLIMPCVLILFLAKNKILKIIIFYLTITVYLVRAFRYIVIIMLVSIAITYFKRKEKTPSFITVLVGIILLIIFIGGLGFMRDNLRTGNSTDWSSFGVDNIMYALESNFDIYKTFYGIVSHYPSDYSYTFGKAMFIETIAMFIPRVFWPNKPLAINASIALAVRRSVSEFAIVNAAMATPNIGEYYVDFGIIGCIIFMFLFGKLSKWTTRFYYYSNNRIENIVLYSIMMPTFMQLVIRGYTPTNFYLVIFLLWPFIIIKNIGKRSGKIYGTNKI